MEENSKELGCRWFFAPYNKTGKQGPNSAISKNFTGTPIPSLVRESIQNSIDARSDASQPVDMVFQFGHIQSHMFPNFFKIRDHIIGIGNAYPEIMDKAQAMAARLSTRNGRVEQVNYIKLSDSNTTGMPFDGSINTSKFDAFVQSEGTTAKDSRNSGGHYGFGKGAYFNISPIRTLLVSTHTADTHEHFFQGVALLSTNKVDGTLYNHRGFYDCNEGDKPVDCVDLIPEKFRKDTPGTDIYIMGIDSNNVESYCNEIIIESIRYFWPAILAGMLKVTVKRADTIIESIDKDSLATLIADKFPNIENNRKTNNPRLYYDLYVNQGSDSNTYCKVEKELPNLGKVCLYLMKHKGLKDTISYYRMPHMIVCNKRTSTDYGFYGVFECLNPQGDEYLGKMENSAHDEWNKKYWTIDDVGTPDPQGAIIQAELETFIQDAIRSVFRGETKDKCSISAFSKYMSIPEENDSSVDDDAETNPFSGVSVKRLDDIGLPTTTRRRKKIKRLTKKEQQNVMAVVQTDAVKDDDGGLQGGGTGKTDNPSPEPKPHPGSDTYKEDDNGQPGIYARPIKVSFRVISQSRTDGCVGYNHICKINNPGKEIENCRIIFMTRGEQQDEEITIASTTSGRIRKNMLTNLHLLPGLNEITITFNDDIRHSLNLTAYEDRH